MYKGRFVEEGTTDDIFENPQHIYTKRLLNAIPSTNPRVRDELTANRKKVNMEFEARSSEYFDETGLAYPLKKISNTHSVSILKGVK
jgi:peptide/nickel transport system ATP-binding protein